MEMWCCKTFFDPNFTSLSLLERSALKGDSPVNELKWVIGENLEYRLLDIRREFGGHLPLTLNMS